MSLYSGLGSGGPGPSAHQDVLSAAPSTPDSTRALVEEIKRRGRACVMSKAYPDADALYGKGIEVLSPSNAEGDRKDLAIFYANRSLVRMQMGKIAEALEDADESVRADATYVKGHWRRGQASSACGNAAEALSSFERALELEPGNKALKKEVKVAGERVAEEERLLEEARKAREAAAEAGEDDGDGNAVMKEEAPKPAAVKMTAPAKAAPEKKAEKKSGDSSSVKDAEDGGFTKSDHVRGYKIRSDGKKTSYFDREIDDEAKRLIGDIAPKKLGEGGSGGEGPRPLSSAAPAAEGTSAWNKAGTWEERDVTPWAKETLAAALLGCEYVLPDGSPSPGARASVAKVRKLDGHASFATVRGKKRYIYEFAATVEWVFTLGDDHAKTCHGEMTFPDVDGTVELGEGYDVTKYSVDGGSAPGTGPLLQRFVKDGGLRDEIHGGIDGWVRTFREAY